MATCSRTYNFCIAIEPQPTTTWPFTSGMTCTCPERTSVNQYTETITIQSCAKEVYTTVMYSVNNVCTPTTVYASVGQSSTTTLKSQIRTTNMLSTSSSTNTSYLSPSICPQSSERALILLNVLLPATGALVGLLIVLLLVVCTGWMCTCRTMKKKGRMNINVIQDR